ncbi:MAG TPA: cysteine desulfurase family protein [Bryobacteraceae bacterium]
MYFDHNATTPIAPEAAQVLSDALQTVQGNASSVHSGGQIARLQIENARRTIAASLGATPAELVFTSGGTESNNLAIFGLLRALPAGPKHVLASSIEHPSVLECFRRIASEGMAVDIVDPADLEGYIRPETVLVSVMQANNETGDIQPIEQIAALVRAHRAAGQAIWFHSDGVQAFGKTPVDLSRLEVDLYSISAHKIHGPKGIGALFVRKGTPLAPLLAGGRQERGRRAGTENVPASMAFACAVELCGDADRCPKLRDRFEAQVLGALDDTEINGRADARLPNTSNLMFRGVSAEALLIALDLKGMAVSTGSACSSGSIEPSHVLLAMGRTKEEANSSIRFSFGRYNTVEEIDALSDAVIVSVRQLRKRMPRENRLAAV